jgi:hypothetical protein
VCGFIEATYHDIPTLHDLKATAVDIVIAQVIAENGTKGNLPNSIPVTHFLIHINQTIKGSATPGSNLLIRQQGGENSDGVMYQVVGDPRYTIGQNYVFFLDYWGTSLTSVAGPEGTFVIKNGNVFSMDTVTSQASWVPIRIGGEPLQIFVSEIGAA